MSAAAPFPVSYCGPAPVPDSLLASWNFDPFLLGALAILWIVIARYGPSATAGRTGIPGGGYNAAAIAVLLIAFVSPLCAASAALFSARVVHHVLLIAVAAPLLALALPMRGMLQRVPVAVWTFLHALAVWVWHAPAPYLAALSSVPVYWAMELTLIISAVLMWQAILSPGTAPGRALAALLATVIQMGLLGALLTFATRPLFLPHFTTTEAFGLSALQDQQLAGLLMWVPASLPYLAAALLMAARLFHRPTANA